MNKRDKVVILPAESVQAVEFENMQDIYWNARRATVEEVFDRFNDSVSTIEAENEYAVELTEIYGGQVPFEAMRVREFVSDYDNFINAPNFETDIFSVGKLEMENFWRFLDQYNPYRIVNRAETYGKTAIYQFAKGKHTVGFLLNNMTHDGQNSVCLTSVSHSANARKPFTETKRYPTCSYSKRAVVRQNKETGEYEKVSGEYRTVPNRWARVLKELNSVGASAVDAWLVLETADSKFFYGEMKKHNWLTESDKQVLKSIRKMPRVSSFDCLLEVAEAELREAEAELEANPTVELGNGSVVPNYEAYEVFQEKQLKYWRLTEEHNSDVPKTTLEDYLW